MIKVQMELKRRKLTSSEWPLLRLTTGDWFVSFFDMHISYHNYDFEHTISSQAKDDDGQEALGTAQAEDNILHGEGDPGIVLQCFEMGGGFIDLRSGFFPVMDCTRCVDLFDGDAL